MTVQELIKELQSCNQDAKVYIHFHTDENNMTCDSHHDDSYEIDWVQKSWADNDMIVGVWNGFCIRM